MINSPKFKIPKESVFVATLEIKFPLSAKRSSMLIERRIERTEALLSFLFIPANELRIIQESYQCDVVKLKAVECLDNGWSTVAGKDK